MTVTASSELRAVSSKRTKRMSSRVFVFVCLLATVFLVTGVPAEAQQLGKVYRVGYLSPGPVNEVFLERLRELGYVEGKNIIFEYRLEATG